MAGGSRTPAAHTIAIDVFIEYERLKQSTHPSTTSDQLSVIRKPQNWAYFVGRCSAIDALRNERIARIHVPYLSKNVVDSDNSPEELTLKAQRERLIQRGLLSLEFQEAFYLFSRYWMEFSPTETGEFWAEVTGERFCIRSHVKRLEKANDCLRRKLEPLAL